LAQTEAKFTKCLLNQELEALAKIFRFAAFLKTHTVEMNPKILLRMTPLRGARHVWTTYVLPVMMVARTIFLAGNYAMQMEA